MATANGSVREWLLLGLSAGIYGQTCCQEINWAKEASLSTFLPGARFLYLTTKADKAYFDWAFANDDCLIFGRETGGLPENLLRENWDRCLTIPMLNPKVRSLNLAVSVGIVLYEALKQTVAFKTT